MLKNPRGFTKEQERELFYEYFLDELTIEQLGLKYGVSATTVQNFIKDVLQKTSIITKVDKDVLFGIFTDYVKNEIKAYIIKEKYSVNWALLTDILKSLLPFDVMSKSKMQKYTHDVKLVQSIIEDYKSGEFSCREIAKKYNISENQLATITRRYRIMYGITRQKMSKKHKVSLRTKQIIDDYLNTDMSLEEIGKKYGCSRQNIDIIVRYHVPIDLIRKYGYEKLTENDIKTILDLYLNKRVTIEKIAKKFGIYYMTISKIIKEYLGKSGKLKVLDSETIEKVIDDYLNSDLTLKDIATKHNVREATVLNVVRKHVKRKDRRKPKYRKTSKIGRKINFSKEEIDLLLDDYLNRGLTIKEMCEKHNISSVTLMRIINKYIPQFRKIPDKAGIRKSFSQKEINFLLDDYLNSDLTMKEICKKYNVSIARLRNLVNRKIPRSLRRTSVHMKTIKAKREKNLSPEEIDLLLGGRN